MACRMIGAKPLSEPMLCCSMDHWEQILMKFDRKFEPFIRENSFENVSLRYGGYFVSASMY